MSENVKNALFLSGRTSDGEKSLVIDAIKCNDTDSLMYLLKLEKFESDTGSRSGLLLH
jgi:hypothetical protein